MTLYELRDTSIDRAKLSQLLAPVETSDNQALPHVLIIDEINRGNIARIFGELITLLESDKRLGAEDARSLVLPYSKQLFSVPGNVYVIGTMNTADKSLIQMDLALRRRFSFTEMPATGAVSWGHCVWR
jgi:5-methylcytosine-specific restriction protein B